MLIGYIKLWDNQREGIFDGSGAVSRAVWGFVLAAPHGHPDHATWLFVWDGTYP